MHIVDNNADTSSRMQQLVERISALETSATSTNTSVLAISVFSNSAILPLAGIPEVTIAAAVVGFHLALRPCLP